MDFRKNLEDKLVQSLDGQRDGACIIGDDAIGTTSYLEACRLTRAQVGELDDVVSEPRFDDFPGNRRWRCRQSGLGRDTVWSCCDKCRDERCGPRRLRQLELDYRSACFSLSSTPSALCSAGAVSNAGNLRAWARRELRLPNDDREIERILSTASVASRQPDDPSILGDGASADLARESFGHNCRP